MSEFLIMVDLDFTDEEEVDDEKTGEKTIIPASGKLFISLGDELIAQTSDSLKYMHTAGMTKGGNALFYRLAL